MMSDDDDSFTGPGCSKTVENDTMDEVLTISSDEEFNNMSTETDIISNDEDFPEVIIKKNKAIKSLFSSKNKPGSVTKNQNKKPVKALFTQKQNLNVTVDKTPKFRPPIEAPKEVFKRMIEGVNVMLPVNPYGSQVALMSKVIIYTFV